MKKQHKSIDVLVVSHNGNHWTTSKHWYTLVYKIHRVFKLCTIGHTEYRSHT